MLKQRIITALILIPLTLLILFFATPMVFLIVTGLVMLGGAWEWSNLMAVKPLLSRCAYLALAAFIMFLAVEMPSEDVAFIFIGAFIWWLLALLLVVFYPKWSAMWNNVVVKGLMGFFVLIPCWAAVNGIRNQQGGIYALLFLFVLIWGADSTAYFVGKKWGKTKLAPLVSPGKSWQGAIGAIVFACVITLALLCILGTPLSLWCWGLVLTIATVIFSIVGDLFESMLKRQVGLKDSGQLLPGHGGLLDRIDSLTAAAPFFAFGAWWLSTYLD